MSEDKEVVIFQAPKIEAPELRVYYNDDGDVLFYTCDKVDGKYLVIDNLTYAEARLDLQVVDGKLIKKKTVKSIGKLKPSTKGTKCHKEDISVIVSDSDTSTEWEYKINE
jgi:hypothetical protein